MKNWIKPIVFVISVLVLAYFLPHEALGPWKLFNLKKIALLVLSLAFIQIIGSFLSQMFGHKMGSVLSGFFSGLISSTASTASIARNNKNSPEQSSTDTLTFLSSTLAMLFEAVVLVWGGVSKSHPSLFILFLGPILTTVFMMLLIYVRLPHKPVHTENKPLEILTTIRLAVFIMLILLISKSLEKIFGQTSLLVFTFLVSLFEIHGSVIANIQLHNTDNLSILFLGNLLAVSILASYLSKLFLVVTLGSPTLKAQIFKCIFIILLSLFVSGLIFFIFV